MILDIVPAAERLAPGAGAPSRRGRTGRPALADDDGIAASPLRSSAAAVAADPQHAWRGEPRERKQDFAQRRGIDTSGLHTVREIDTVLEAVLGEPDFLPSRWMREGAAVADAVGRIRTPTALGTGFLVSPWLLMTNSHVLPSGDVAADSVVTFRYEENDDDELVGAVKLGLRPEACFVTSPVAELDLTLVAVAPAPDGGPPGGTFGRIPAKGATGKILVGQPVNIVQHPDGRPREVAIRNNLLLSVDDAASVTYGTDTEPGSSGSPVFNDRWELVALHHSSSGPLREGGQVPGAVIGNVGIRTSAIVAHVRSIVADPAALTGAGAQAPELLDEFLRTGEE